MATDKQLLGNRGEQLVVKLGSCPKCKRKKTFKALPANFKCADVICDFCGYQAQVKATTVADPAKLPATIPGAAWGPQKERMDAGIFFPLYIVAEAKNGPSAVYFLPADFQTFEMFKPRKPLSETARRAGWQGFVIDLRLALSAPVRLL